MKVLVIKGSPHLHGTSNTIAQEFIKGAKEANNEVRIFDTAHSNLHGCLACDQCAMNGDCIQKDDGNKLINEVLSSDCLVFVTPVYYFGVSAQLKMAIDRFYARNGLITRKHLKVAYIAAAWNDDNIVMEAISKHFDIITDYLEMEEVGRVLAKGAGTPTMIKKEYLNQAYKLGKHLH